MVSCELSVKNIGKWSETSVFIIPVFKLVLKYLLVKILSSCGYLGKSGRFVDKWNHTMSKHHVEKVFKLLYYYCTFKF